MRTDELLGETVKGFLIEKGVETPMVKNKLSKEKRREVINRSFKTIMEEGLGLDLSDDSLIDTPKRVAKMYVDEVFYGLEYKNFPAIATVENKMQYDEMVLIKDVNVQSNCEHHFVVIDGIANVGYIPNKKVLGLSKINRIVEFFSKRPQIQERLTEQIFYALSLILETDDIAVMINASHYCVKSRGVQDVNSSTTTSKLGGAFKNSDLRKEYLSLIK